MATKRIEFPIITVMATAKCYVKDQLDNQPSSAVRDRVPGAANDPKLMGTVREEDEVFTYRGRSYPHLQPVVEDGQERYVDDKGAESVRPKWKAVAWPKECAEATLLIEQEADAKLREEQRIIRESRMLVEPGSTRVAEPSGARR